MKKLLIVSLIVSIVSFVLMILNFLASTDIYHDYVSKDVVSTGIKSDVGALPEWTNCSSEWQMSGIDFIVRLLFMLLILYVLITLNRTYKNRQTS
jgi:TRAP-type C4-dicarboxylate transport system permease small subunit